VREIRLTTPTGRGQVMFAMKQFYHSIIKSRPDGQYVAWVEEIPGAITRGRSIEECRSKLRESLQLVIETNRHEARLWIDQSCVQDVVEVELDDERQPVTLH
jgi:predicted RNase H-like HicB family nuclease